VVQARAAALREAVAAQRSAGKARSAPRPFWPSATAPVMPKISPHCPPKARRGAIITITPTLLEGLLA
jgi:hypothetical protein